MTLHQKHTFNSNRIRERPPARARIVKFRTLFAGRVKGYREAAFSTSESQFNTRSRGPCFSLGCETKFRNWSNRWTRSINHTHVDPFNLASSDKYDSIDDRQCSK